MSHIAFSELHLTVKNALCYAMQQFSSEFLEEMLIPMLFEHHQGLSFCEYESEDYSNNETKCSSDMIYIDFHDSSMRYGELSLNVNYNYAGSKISKRLEFYKCSPNDPFYQTYDKGRNYINAVKIIIYRMYMYLDDCYHHNDTAHFKVYTKNLTDSDYIDRFLEAFKIIYDYETDSRLIKRFLYKSKDMIGNIIDACTELGYSELLMIILRLTNDNTQDESKLRL